MFFDGRDSRFQVSVDGKKSAPLVEGYLGKDLRGEVVLCFGYLIGYLVWDFTRNLV